jgi:phosphotransferase system enzyme I (PtsI)
MAVGRVCFWTDPETFPRYPINPEMIPDELKRLDEALATSQEQLDRIRQRVERELGQEEAAIFSAHNLLLNDPAFYAQVEEHLRRDQLNLEAVVADVIEELAKVFLKIADPYMNERADDYRDVGRRVLENLLSYQRQCTLDTGELIIMVARELMPSDTVQFHRHHVGAFITERGGISSHAAILARSLRLPAVVGIAGIASQLRAGERVLVDGYTGRVIADPDPDLIAKAREDETARTAASRSKRPAGPFRTQDGTEIMLTANLTREDEAQEARLQGALGVGLLRTEFLFMDHGEFLDEQAQYEAYRKVVETMAPHPVTIRTLDLGEDKFFDFDNPMDSQAKEVVLGWRSLRLSLAYHHIFMDQLKAILRAAAHGPVRLLLPMVTGLEDIRAVQQLVLEASRRLTEEGIAHPKDIPIGAMIETPAAAIMPDVLLQAADFLSVGTNDLVQYTLVADRTSERMQGYYRPTAPAVLFLLRRLAEAAKSRGKDISICGEIAGDPLYLALLIGLGYRSLSVAPVLLPDLAAAVGKLTVTDSEALARRCLQMATADDVEGLLRQELKRA